MSILQRRREVSLVSPLSCAARPARLWRHWPLIGASVVLLGSTLCAPSPPAQAGVLSRLQNAIGSLWGQRAEKREAATGARGRAAALGARVETVADRLEATQRRLLRVTEVHDNIARQLRRTEAQIVRTRHHVQIATRRYEAQRRRLGQRVAAMQRSGRLGHLQLMLSARSLTELSRRAYYFNAVASRDAALKAQLEADRLELERVQNLLTAQWNERQALASATNRERLRVAGVAAEERAVLRELNSNRYALLAYAEAQEQSAREIEAMIGSLSARRAALAAQAARDRAERAAQRRNSAFGSSGAASRESSRAAGNSLRPMPLREVAYYDAMRPENSGDGGSLRESLATEEHHEHDGHNHGSGEWAAPVRGRLSSRFGIRFHPILRRRKLHTGDDLAARHGAPFKAARAGTVLWSGWKKAYGNTVIVDHGDGVCTLYGHASKLGVAAGQSVGAGQYLGNVGSTGWSTGPHLHFEVRKNGKPVNPRAYLRRR